MPYMRRSSIAAAAQCLMPRCRGEGLRPSMHGCRSPLPPLFMRFVIQAVTHAPQLRGFVCDTLAALVNKAVWANPQQWKGWLVCVSNLVPDSLPVLLQVRVPPQ